MSGTMKALRAGRALDALVAEKVMGATWDTEWARGYAILRFSGEGMHLVTRAPDGKTTVNPCCPHYSTSISAAFQIVEAFSDSRLAMRYTEFVVALREMCVQDYDGWGDALAWFLANPSKAALHISRAALAAVGGARGDE